MDSPTRLQWRKFLPKNKAERLAMVAAMLELLVLPFFEAFVILPKLFGHFTASYWVHFVFGFFLWFNVVGNMVMSIITDLSAGGTILPSILKPGWKYCSWCTMNSPPRSYHCIDCDCCVLQRDHHCFFTGKCIGHNNMRYYLMMLVYLALGALYCNYLNMDYALELIGKMSWRGILTMFIPMLGWLFGDHTTMSFLACVQCGICLFSFLQFVVLLYFHLTMVTKGQTTYEWRNSHARKYNEGWKANFIGAVGKRWYLAWICPVISSPLPHDGINFKETNGIQGVKDM